MNIIKQIKNQLKKDTRSINRIAKEFGIQQASLSRFVNGTRSMSLESFSKLANYYDLILTKSI